MISPNEARRHANALINKAANTGKFYAVFVLPPSPKSKSVTLKTTATTTDLFGRLSATYPNALVGVYDDGDMPSRIADDILFVADLVNY